MNANLRAWQSLFKIGYKSIFELSLYLLLFFQFFDTYSQLNLRGELIAYVNVPVTWNQTGNIQLELNDGLNNLSKGSFGAAAANFSNVLKLDSTLSYARYYKGAALKSSGELRASLKEFQVLIDDGSGFFEAFLEQGKVNMLLLNFNEGIRLFGVAKRVDPSSPWPDYFLGIMHMMAGDFKNSVPFFEKSLQLDETCFRAKNKLAFAKSRLNEETAALRLLNETLQKHSNNTEALTMRAQLTSSKDPMAAILDLNTVVLSAPKDYYSLILRGLIQTKMKNYAPAFSDFRKVLQDNPINEALFKGHETPLDNAFDLQYAGYHLLANMYGFDEENMELIKASYCLLFVKDFYQAIKTIKEVTGYRNHAFCLLLLGLAYEGFGDHENALKTYERTLKIDDKIWNVHMKIAIYRSSQGNWPEAEREFSKAIDIKRDFASLYKLRGVARFELQRYQDAESDFDEYLRTDSLDHEAINNRVETYVQLKKYKRAITDYLKANDTTRWGRYDIDKFKKISKWMLAIGDTVQAVNLAHRLFLKSSEKDANDLKFVILLAQKDNKLLMLHFKHFSKFAEDHPEIYFPENTWIIKAATYSKLGDYVRAEYYFEKAKDFHRDNPWFYYYRAKMFAKQGRIKEARNDFRLANDLGMDEARNELKMIN
jgi:tetratricopeptide (TPR) repeat protein